MKRRFSCNQLVIVALSSLFGISCAFVGAAHGSDDATAPSISAIFDSAPERAKTTLLIRAPAAPAELEDLAREHADQGYAVLLQTHRLPTSITDAEAWLKEDTALLQDTLAWIRQQPFSNGSIALLAIGASACASLGGTAAEAVADAQVLLDAPRRLADLFFVGGHYRVAEHAAVIAATHGLEFDSLTEPRLPPATSKSWRPLASAGALRVPTLHVTGWFRPGLTSTLTNWTNARGADNSNAYLLIGAWVDGTDDSALSLGGRSETLDEAMSWLREALDGTRAGGDEGRVRFDHFVATRTTRANESTRLEADDWPPACEPCEMRSWYLQAGGDLTLAEPGPNAPSSYRYDPNEPIVSIGGSAWDAASLVGSEHLGKYPMEALERGPLDQRRIPERRDYLRFRSSPLDRDIVVRGNARMHLWLASDAQDTAFIVKLVAIQPNGYQALLREVAVATQRRVAADRDAAPLSYGIAEKVELELGPMSVTVPEGHRIGVQITSSSWPAFAIHPNTDRTEPASTPARPAYQSIFHDSQRPSALLLPSFELAE